MYPFLNTDLAFPLIFARLMSGPRNLLVAFSYEIDVSGHH